MAAGFLTESQSIGTVSFPNGEKKAARFHDSKQRPLVSCVMVSRGNPEILRHSVNCFLRQTYENRELVIVVKSISPELQSYLDSIRTAPRPVHIHAVPASLELGDVRNMAIARAEGTLVCSWDDDDLHHPRYLDHMVGFMEASGVDIAFLNQLTMWWPARKIFALTKYRIWEGSMVAHRALIPIYPSLDRSEDSVVVRAMVRRRAFVVVQAPQLYIYAVTGENTWDEGHMEGVISGEGSARSEPGDYDAIFDRLDSLYGVADYQRYCLRARPSTIIGGAA
jgi:glycosyltransferase involved in cell wall biosynthesis